MKILIVEDELLAAERLQTILKNYDSTIEIVGCFESIEDTVRYLRSHAHPDILLLDIYLSDGLSFEIFRQVECARPVIFTTAYDNYTFEAFKMLSIDYILKPVTQEALSAALNKFRVLKQSIAAPNVASLLENWSQRSYRKRILGKIGQRIFFVDTDQISYFTADNKIVNMIDKDGHRYLVEHTMEALLEMLDAAAFFRTSRSYIINITSILHVKPYYNRRLRLTVKGMPETEEIIVSRERALEFKVWAEGHRT